MQSEVKQNLAWNYTVNLLDGAFFGFALGFSSFTTVVPLFISTLTSSAVLIGLIPSIHMAGWHLPQLFVARGLNSSQRFRPLVLRSTLHERLPFLALAVIAMLSPIIGPRLSLGAVFLALVWQGVGGGLVANPWQNLVVRVIPGEIRATFFGLQTAGSNLLGALGAVAAGFILTRYTNHQGYAITFLFGFVMMLVSLFFLASNREPAPDTTSEPLVDRANFWSHVGRILRSDHNFRWFLVGRILTPFAMVSFTFYAVYMVKDLGATEATAGVLTAISLLAQLLGNPLAGWLSDKWSTSRMLTVGALATMLSSLLAFTFRSVGVFYLVQALAGIGYLVYWTIGIAFSTRFGHEDERPVYIGLSNTLIAPSAILAPILGGWLADTFGYPFTFLAAAIAGLGSVAIYYFLVRDPEPQPARPVNLA